jgi:glycosyltransferase involved in cell wall biosynthesis
MKKYAVMLPIGYRGGTLRAAKNIAKSLVLAARMENQELEVVFSYPEIGNYDPSIDFADLLEFGISIRSTVWQVTPAASLSQAVKLFQRFGTRLVDKEYCIPKDGANDFFDCDLWILISDRLPAPIVPIKKYVVFIFDYIQRYVPEIWVGNEAWQKQDGSQFSLARNAEHVYVTTPSTRMDAIAYAGVTPRKVSIAEMDFQPIELPVRGKSPISIEGMEGTEKGYILLPTNASAHKNLLTALKALERYYLLLGGDLHVVVTGYDSNIFDPNQFKDREAGLNELAHIRECRELVKNSSALQSHIHFIGEVPDQHYARYLANARFLWNPTIYDNGTFSVIEAAYLGVPSLSARYPAMEFLDEKFKLQLTFSDPFDIKKIADAICSLEATAAAITLPSQAELRKHSWESHAADLYHQIIQWE